MRHPPWPDDPKRNPDDGQIDGGSRDGIEALPDRVNRYAKAKNQALDIAEYMGLHLAGQSWLKRTKRLSECGEYLAFRHYPTVNRVRLHSASMCMQHLLCPLCAIRRGAKALKRYLDRWEYLHAQNSALRPFLVTLTVKDGAHLDERFKHLHKAQALLWSRKRKQPHLSSMAGVAGAVWSYEIKRGKGSGLWHPHLHMIALAESPPGQDALSREWHGITGDSFIVDVRPIDMHDPASGFVEVFKYAVKFSDQPPRDTVAAFEMLRGKRLMDSAGLFRGVVVPDDLMDDLEDLDGLPFVTYFYRFLHGAGGYDLQRGNHVG